MGPKLASGLFLAFFLGSACSYRVPGEEGRLEFSSRLDPRAPIAVGARIDLDVVDAASRRSAPVLAAAVDAPELLRVLSSREARVELEALAPGTTTLRVVSRVMRGNVADSLTLRTVEAARVVLRHHCTEELSANYFAGGESVPLSFGLRSADDEALVGYGFFPVESEPPGAIAITSPKGPDWLGWIQLAFPSEPGSATLRSTLDETALDFTFVKPEDVDGAVLGIFPGVFPADPSTLEELVVNQPFAYWAAPTVAGSPVCWGVMRAEATSETPGVCTAEPLPASEADETSTLNIIRVTPHQEGTCTFRVSLPEAAGGAGLTQSFSVRVRAPSE